MRITQNLREIKSNQVLDIAVDVHEETLNFFFSLEGKEYRDDARTEPGASKSACRIITALPRNRASRASA